MTFYHFSVFDHCHKSHHFESDLLTRAESHPFMERLCVENTEEQWAALDPLWVKLSTLLHRQPPVSVVSYYCTDKVVVYLVGGEE